MSDKLEDALRQLTEARSELIQALSAVSRLTDRLTSLTEILADPANQLGQTPGCYFIYRFDLATMHRIVDALDLREPLAFVGVGEREGTQKWKTGK